MVTPPLSSVVAASVADFIDYSLWVVIVLLVYYIIKFFVVSPPSKEEREARRGEESDRADKFVEWISDKMKDRKKKEVEYETTRKETAEKSRKKSNVNVVKESIRKALEDMEHAISELNRGELKNAVSHTKEVIEYVERAIEDLQYLRHKYRHKTEDREKLHTIIEHLHAIERTFTNDVMKKLPRKVPKNHDEWVNAVKDPISAILSLRGSLGNIWKGLDEFHS